MIAGWTPSIRNVASVGIGMAEPRVNVSRSAAVVRIHSRFSHADEFA